EREIARHKEGELIPPSTPPPSAEEGGDLTVEQEGSLPTLIGKESKQQPLLPSKQGTEVDLVLSPASKSFSELLDVTREEFIKAQKDDKDLEVLWQHAEAKTKHKNAS